MEDYQARARKRAQERSTSFWYKLKEGENTFRILETPESETTPAVFYEYNIHRNVGPKKKMVRCGVDPITQEGKCWLCRMKDALAKKGHGARALALEPQMQTLFQVGVITADGLMTGPFGFTPSRTVADQLITAVSNPKRKYADHKKGRNFNISRTGTGMTDTKYGMIATDDDQSEVPAKLVAKLKPFSELKELSVYDEATQKAAYEGREIVEEPDEEEEDLGEEIEEEPEEPTPAPRRVSAKPTVVPKKKPAPEPEPEEELEVEEENLEDDAEVTEPDLEEEEPAPPPKKKGAPVKKAPEPEPEEDDLEGLDEFGEDDPADEIEPEEEEPAPPPKKRAPLPPPKKASPPPPARRR